MFNSVISDSMLSGLIFLLSLLGMIALMITSNRHIERFQHKLPSFLSRQGLRWLGLALLAIAFLLTYFSYQTGYFVVVWFASLTVTAGLVYLAVIIYEQLERVKQS